jgi:hypothetical protein
LSYGVLQRQSNLLPVLGFLLLLDVDPPDPRRDPVPEEFRFFFPPLSDFSDDFRF